MSCDLADHISREREREKFNLSIQPALAYEDVSMLESSAKLRMAERTLSRMFWDEAPKQGFQSMLAV